MNNEIHFLGLEKGKKKFTIYRGSLKRTGTVEFLEKTGTVEKVKVYLPVKKADS